MCSESCAPHPGGDPVSLSIPVQRPGPKLITGKFLIVPPTCEKNPSATVVSTGGLITAAAGTETTTRPDDGDVKVQGLQIYGGEPVVLVNTFQHLLDH